VSVGADIRDIVFRYRSYTPIPFLVAMVVFAEPTVLSLICGGVLVLAGEGLRFWGVSIVGAETRTTGSVGGTYLVTTGPYAFVRNPLYAGNMMIYLGVGVMSMALFPWLHLAAAGWFYLQYALIVSREEEYLRETFGKAYAVYCSAVPRFFPRLSPYRTASAAPKRFSPTEGLASERRTLQAILLVTVLVLVRFGMREWW
jgi:protein-S-isoprenylcysteine O-methyltransferase Ste14